MDFHLSRNDDGTFSAHPFSQPADIRYVSPALEIINDPFALWLQRIECMDDYLDKALKWIKAVNQKLFHAFDELYKPIEG